MFIFYESYCLHCYSLTLSMPLSPLHKRGLFAMHAATAGVLRGQGGESGLRKQSGLQHGPSHIITIYFLESVRSGRAIASPSPVSLFSADTCRAIRFRLSTVYSITVPHVSEIARQRVSPLVSGVRARLPGVRRVRVVSVPPFPLELVKHNIFTRPIDKMTRTMLSRLLGGVAQVI